MADTAAQLSCSDSEPLCYKSGQPGEIEDGAEKLTLAGEGEEELKYA